MKKIVTLLILMASMFSQIISYEIPQVVNILSRDKISLNGKWNYIVDIQESGFYDIRMQPSPYGFFLNAKMKKPDDLVEYDFDKAPEMEIPSDWNTKENQLFFYEGTVWFKKSFNYSPKSGKRVILYFGAVNYVAIVYLNTKLLGKHVGGFTPFNYDVTDLIKDGENFVILKVDNKRKKENVPTEIFDWWNYGGITRDVFLVETEQVFIQNYFLRLDKTNQNQVLFNAELSSKISGKALEVSIPELRVLETFNSDSDGKILTLSQRNKFNPGDELEIVEPFKRPVQFQCNELFDENMQEISSANHAMMTVKIKTDKTFTAGSIVRKRSK